MDDVKQLLETARSILRENPGLAEAEFRELMLERFREADQGLQKDAGNMVVGGDPGPTGGVFALFMLPWTLFRWLGWRGRLAKHRADLDEVVRVLRQEGHFAPKPA